MHNYLKFFCLDDNFSFENETRCSLWPGARRTKLSTRKNGRSLSVPGFQPFLGIDSLESRCRKDNRSDLYRLTYIEDNEGNFIGTVTQKDKMHFHRKGEGPRFLYGSGYYHDKSLNQFHVYACESQLQHNQNSCRCNKWE